MTDQTDLRNYHSMQKAALECINRFNKDTLTAQKMEKINRGRAEKANRYLHPRVGITMRARSTSKHAPTAQNISTKVTQVALVLDGRNSAYRVTLSTQCKSDNEIPIIRFLAN